MARPEDFGFDDESRLLKETARRLLGSHFAAGELHRRVAADPNPFRAPDCAWDRELWARMVELGWCAVAVPAAQGGLGLSATAVAGLLEEVGRVAAPSPLGTTVAATYVLRSCDSGPARRQLARIAGGTAMTLCITDRRGSWEAADSDVTASDGGGGRVRLDGTAWFVQDASKAEAFVVKARSADGLGLYLVDARAPGVIIIADSIVDLTRDQAHVVFDGVDVAPDAVAAEPSRGERVLTDAEPARLMAMSADIVGAAEWQLQTTAEYARTRVQFDRPIGFFQAVKHPLVDMMILIDEARSLLYCAASAIDHEPHGAELYARMAKSAASDAASFCSSRSVQLHGGVGFTWECSVQLYFKRQKHSEMLFGDGAYQRVKLAEALISRGGAP